jgi:hypothetical protein
MERQSILLPHGNRRQRFPIHNQVLPLTGALRRAELVGLDRRAELVGLDVIGPAFRHGRTFSLNFDLAFGARLRSPSAPNQRKSVRLSCRFAIFASALSVLKADRNLVIYGAVV